MRACPAERLAGSYVFDGLWQDRFSEPESHELTLSPPPAWDGSGGGGAWANTCLTVSVTVVASTPPRNVNKVKLYSLALF